MRHAAARASQAASKRASKAVTALAVDCQHEITRDAWEEQDNGYGRQWKNFYKRCVFCGHKEETGTTYGHWLK